MRGQTWRANGGYQAVQYPPTQPEPITIMGVRTFPVFVPPPPVLVNSRTTPRVVVVPVKPAATTKPKAKPQPKSVKKVESSPPGIKYMYPKKAACFHIIKNVKVWEEGTTRKFNCHVWKIPTIMSVGELIENLMGKEGDGCKDWAVTEVTEKGNGLFLKGTTVVYGSDKAKGRKVLSRLVVGMPEEVTAGLLSGLSCTSLENHKLAVSKKQNCDFFGDET